MVESIARVRHIRVTPQKARRIVDLIRGKQAEEALAILKFAPQSASEPVYKLVASAMANARVKADASNAFLDERDLVVRRAYVDEGTTLKRFQPRAQGRAFKILKRTSHITIELATPDELAAATAAPAKAPAKAEKPAEKKPAAKSTAAKSTTAKSSTAKSSTGGTKSAAKPAAKKTTEKAEAE